MLTPDTWFQLSTTLVLPAWLLMVAGLLLSGTPAIPLAARMARWALLLAGRVVPLLLATLYAGLILAGWQQAPGGFSSLAQLGELFSAPDMLLAGWVHYLAFDLWVGRWQVDQLNRWADRGGRMDWALRAALVPCLLATLYFGPAGLLMAMAVLALAALRNRRAVPVR